MNSLQRKICGIVVIGRAPNVVQMRSRGHKFGLGGNDVAKNAVGLCDCLFLVI